MSLRRAAAEHGEHGGRVDAGRERVRELGDVDLLVAEVALHEVVVGDDDALDERVVHRVLLGRHVVGHRALRARRASRRRRSSAVSVSRSTTPRKSRLLADGQLERRDAGAELVLQLLERALERRPLAVELVHEDRCAGGRARSAMLPRDLGLHLDALDRGDDEHREVGGLDRGGDVADEVGVARACR